MRKGLIVTLVLSVMICVVAPVIMAKAAPVELTVYLPGDPPAKPDAVWDLINKELEREIGVSKVNFNFVPWSDLKAKLSVKLIAGEGDIFFDAPWNNLNQMIAKGAYAPLDALLQKYGGSVLKGMPQPYWDNNAAKLDGVTYGIPININIANYSVWGYRLDLAKKYGMKTPLKSLADLEQYLTLLAKNNPEMVPFTCNNNTSIWHNYFRRQVAYGEMGPNAAMGYVLDQKTCKVLPFWEYPNFYKDLATIRRWYKAGLIEQDILSQKDDKALWAAGYLGILINDPGYSQTIHLPGVEIGGLKILTPPQKGFVDYAAWNFACIRKDSKNKVQAMKFLNWIHRSQANYDLLHYGISGKDWIPVGAHTFRYPEGYDPAINYQFPWYVLGGDVIHHRLSADLSKEDLALTLECMDAKNFIPNRLAGFVFDAEPSKTEIAMCQVLEPKVQPYFDGVVDQSDGLAGVIQQYKDAGYLKIIAEMQKQADAFLASKH